MAGAAPGVCGGDGRRSGGSARRRRRQGGGGMVGSWWRKARHRTGRPSRSFYTAVAPSGRAHGVPAPYTPSRRGASPSSPKASHGERRTGGSPLTLSAARANVAGTRRWGARPPAGRAGATSTRKRGRCPTAYRATAVPVHDTLDTALSAAVPQRWTALGEAVPRRPPRLAERRAPRSWLLWRHVMAVADTVPASGCVPCRALRGGGRDGADGAWKRVAISM